MSIELTAVTIRDVKMYQIPPRTSNKGYRADSWGLDKPAWVGILRVVSKGSECFIRLIDKNSGDLFVQAPVDAFPGVAVESCIDSSRYFVIRALDDASGQHAFVGIGFNERTEAFDFNVALGDHFKHEAQSKEAAAAADEPYVSKHATGGLTGPIKINLKSKSTKKEKPDDGGFAGLEAPPGLWGPSHSAAPAPAAAANPFAAAPTNPFAAAPAANPFATAAPAAGATGANPFAAAPPAGSDDFGDFTAAPTSGTGTSKGDWVQF
mmetsp:Transcript_5063/g.13136  ORF Transcript_5063/g.13136 Transcript_5063/m.13136 type:complete len:265 (+) Transcript_5063:96-890(+)|eukprot:CAMPEP_0182927922 /NCGR_PEP_ID=MMETSP0105_2-20130417/14712_1 /TAXON_ID=81532 ORGANISM="Acanthoeca-like sp., Strain 10tr" /NCGR_SAMPLE_ID=MMETSP0105_2 /ASSEMBLY_ACC=CAM_ASM_000205 /LENGTH=264 /DNA_ID=CAMNT_0025065901 /DNA_START=96 /DNA_END=890 /DNA_ORIENTATION=-